MIGRITNSSDPVPPSALKFESKVISRKHAQLFVNKNKLCVRDTSSSSGTFVNKLRLSPQGKESAFVEIFDGNEIMIGEDCKMDGGKITANKVMHQAVIFTIRLDSANINSPDLAEEATNGGFFVPLNRPAEDTKDILIEEEDGDVLGATPSYGERGGKGVTLARGTSTASSAMAKTSSMASISSSQLPEGDVFSESQTDIDQEFNTIWNGIQQGLEPRVKRLINGTGPYADILKSLGAFGVFESKDDFKTRSKLSTLRITPTLSRDNLPALPLHSRLPLSFDDLDTKQIQAVESAIKWRDLGALRYLALKNGGFIREDLRVGAYDLLLHLSTNSTYETMDLHINRDILNQIQLDVDRTFSKQFSTEDLTQIRENLVDLVSHIFRRMPWLHYYQGFHEVAGTLLLLLGDKAKPALAAISVIYLRDYMEASMDTTISHCNLIMLILRRIDARLYKHMSRMSDFNAFFSIPWVLTWFSHCIQNQKLVRLFDVLITQPPSYLLHLSVQLLLLKRDGILDCEDMSAVLMILNLDFEEIDLDSLLRAADVQAKTNYFGDLYGTLGHYAALNTYEDFQELDASQGIDFKQIEQWANRKRARPYDQSIILAVGILGLAVAFLIRRGDLL